MKILTPVSELPSCRGKYAPLYDAAIAADGAWIPVEFETVKEARQLAWSANQNTRLHVAVRKQTVFLRLRESATA